MRKPGLEGAAWPSARQELALRAALLDVDAASAAWDRLAGDLRLDGPDEDPEVLRLVPLVHHNLRRVGVDDPRLEPLATASLRNWYRTRRIIDAVAPALSCLAGAGIPTIVLKGTPLALRYYEQPGLRFVSDVDVLVPFASAARSLDLLAAAGWARGSAIPRERLFRSRHSENLRHPEHGNFDLHWRLAMLLVLASDRKHSEDDFWAAAEPMQVAGVDTFTLGPADLLLHLCVHGSWSSSDATARWVADAVTVLRVAGERLDWDRLVEQAERRRLVVRMRNDLTYLAREFGAPVPARVLEHLWRLPVSGRERRTYLALTREEPPGWARRRWVVYQRRWLEKTGNLPRWRQVYELPGHVQDYFGLAHAWEIPVELSARLARHARRSRPADAQAEPDRARVAR